MTRSHVHVPGRGAGVVTMSQVGGGGCCDQVPGGGEGGRCCDHVPGGGEGAGVVTMSQVGGGRVL